MAAADQAPDSDRHQEHEEEIEQVPVLQPGLTHAVGTAHGEHAEARTQVQRRRQRLRVFGPADRSQLRERRVHAPLRDQVLLLVAQLDAGVLAVGVTS